MLRSATFSTATAEGFAPDSGTWGFSDDYTIGLTLPGGMAIEELVFFTVIPVCGLLTLETVRKLLPRRSA